VNPIVVGAHSPHQKRDRMRGVGEEEVVVLECHHDQPHNNCSYKLSPGVLKVGVILVVFHTPVFDGGYIDEERGKKFDDKIIHNSAPVVGWYTSLDHVASTRAVSLTFG
jgi:hypothetical protein